VTQENFRESRHRGFRIGPWLVTAIAFTIVGLIIASNLSLSPSSVADVPANRYDSGPYPVVERNGQLESPFVSVVERYSSAVVNIAAVTRNQERPWWYGRGPLSTSLGSGFFFRKDGYILTNNHVVDGAVELTVRTASGYEYKADLVGADPQTDLAVIKVEPEEEVTVIPFGDSEDLQVGDWAIAIGNPFPQQGLDRTVTVGVVSAKGRSNLRFGSETPYYQNYIQTDASINPGNSGGPLLNIRGECIGVNAAISSPTGSSVGIGFAVPINIAKAIVPDLISKGHASRGWLGVYLSPVTERIAKQQGLEAVRGAVIDTVVPNSPADQSGILPGDIVTRFNSQEVRDPSQFSVLVSTVHSGMEVPVELVRHGRGVKLRATIGNREKASLASTRPSRSARTTWLGMDLQTFTPQLARMIGSQPIDGVYVLRVYPGSPADRASITPGTVIVEVNGEQVSSVGDMLRIRDEIGNSKQRIPFIVQEPDGTIAKKVCRL